MTKIDIGQAIGSGFRLIGREPRTILAWTGGFLILTLLNFALLAGSFPEILGGYQEMIRTAGEGGDAALGAEQRVFAAMGMALPLMVVVGLLIYVVFISAIYRAVLRPEDRRFFYLRVGKQELMLALAGIIMVVLSIVCSFVVMLVGTLLSGVVGAALAGAGGGGGRAAAGIVVVIGMLASWLVLIWLLLRFALFAPMTWDTGRIQLLQSWRLTKGQSLRIFGVVVGLVLLLILLEIVIIALFGGLAALAGAGGLEGFVNADPQALAGRLAPLMVVFGVVGAAIGVAFYVVLIAPYADMYRQLRPSQEQAEVFA